MGRIAFSRMIKTVCVTVLAVAVAMSMVVLSGCTTSQSSDQATEQQTANRQYMTQVNQIMEDLSDGLDEFADAVARGDVVTMRTQADNAYDALDDLSALEAPEDLADIQTSYVEGCDGLKEALNAYVDLYAEIASATDDQPFDYSTYEERLAAIQEQYDEGIAKLQAGDEAAAALPS